MSRINSGSKWEYKRGDVSRALIAVALVVTIILVFAYEVYRKPVQTSKPGPATTQLQQITELYNNCRENRSISMSLEDGKLKVSATCAEDRRWK